MRFVLAFAIFLALHSTWAEDEEIYDDDMVILEAARVTRETENEEIPEAEGSREGKQFFFGVGSQYPNGFVMQRWGLGFPSRVRVPFQPSYPGFHPRYPVQFQPRLPVQGVQVPIQAPVAPAVPVAPVQTPVVPEIVQREEDLVEETAEETVQADCYTSKGEAGECVTLNQCYSLFEALPKDLPSWALGTKESCIVQNAKADRMGYVSTYGVCCPSSSGQSQQGESQQSRLPAKPAKPVQQQNPIRRQWAGQYPAGTIPLAPGGFPQPGGTFGGGFGGFGGGGFGGAFAPQGGQGWGRPQQPPPGFGGGRPQQPPPGIGGPPGGGFGGGAPQRPPPGVGGPPGGGFGGGRPQGPPPGIGGPPGAGGPPGFGGGQPQGPPPQQPPQQRPQQPPPQKVEVLKPKPEEVKEIISSNDDGDYSACGVSRNKIVYNEEGEEVEQADRAAGKAHPLRVAGGWPADRNEWPWIVMMLNRGNQFCDGSIIDEYHILTAAHCVAQMRASDVSTLTVRAGAHNLKNSANEEGTQNIGVKLVVKHKDFTMQTLHSDIAILVLKSPIKYTSTVRRVCLPSSSTDTYEGKMGTVAGWGLLREGGSRPTVLMELSMKIWNNDKCRTTYGSTAPAGIKETMMCAGKQGKDSCSGDSGGPFVTPVGDHWEQIGVVSWGIGCGKQHYPGVYTRVNKMMDWIDKVRKLYPN